MANPVLNTKTFSQKADELEPGWADRSIPPAPDEVSPWPPPGSAAVDAMTIRGVTSATGVLLTLLVASAVVGWLSVSVTHDALGNASVDLPGGLFIGLIVALGLALVTFWKPTLARITAPLYALSEVFVVGAISHVYEADYQGIVLQAVGLTVAVFAIMLVLFATGRIVVTDKLRTGIIAATGAVMITYVLSIVVNLFGGDIPFIHDSGTFGILFSLAVVGIAASNLLLDFDFCQRAVAAKAPRQMEWFAAFGLMITLVWLYLELLRLLAKLNRR